MNKNTNPTQTDEERELEYLAMNIVYQIGDALYEALPQDVAHEYFVKARQATNDIAIDFAKKLIKSHREQYAEEQVRAELQVIERIEVLGDGLRPDGQGILEHVRERLAQLSPKDPKEMGRAS